MNVSSFKHLINRQVNTIHNFQRWLSGKNTQAIEVFVFIEEK